MACNTGQFSGLFSLLYTSFGKLVLNSCSLITYWSGNAQYRSLLNLSGACKASMRKVNEVGIYSFERLVVNSWAFFHSFSVKIFGNCQLAKTDLLLTGSQVLPSCVSPPISVIVAVI